MLTRDEVMSDLINKNRVNYYRVWTSDDVFLVSRSEGIYIFNVVRPDRDWFKPAGEIDDEWNMIMEKVKATKGNKKEGGDDE